MTGGQGQTSRLATIHISYYSSLCLSDDPSQAAAGLRQDTRFVPPEPQSMNCPNCNTEIDESDRFCQHCGQALSDAREEGKEDSKATAIPTAIRNLDGVDDKLLNRPEIGYLSTVLEDGELPDFIVAGAYGGGCLVATNRRVIQVEYSFSASSFKSKSFAYGEVLSFESYSGVLGAGVRIHKSDGEVEGIVTERSRTRAFVDHVNAKIQQMKTANADIPLPLPASKTEGPEKTSDELDRDTGKNQKEADSQPKVSSGYKKESDSSNKNKLLGCAVIGVIILVSLLALIGSCGDLPESDVAEVEAAVPLHGLIDDHDRYNGKRVKVRGHVGSIGWEVWGGHQPGLSDFVLLGPLGGPHPNYAAFCRVDRSHVAEFRGLRQGQAVIVSGRYRYEEGTRPVELEDCRRVSE